MPERKRQIHTSAAPEPIGPFSQALRVGPFVYVAGQGPGDAATGEIVHGTIEEQTALTLDNVKAILAAAGATMDDVVRCTVWLSDLDEFARYNAVYETYFGDPKPTRATVGAQLLGGIKVEIEVTAYLGETTP
ncbi:MAG: endoribonuclease [Solirubrobacterales bacterium]|jgi:2-iminobutanoate/2-iminopropanoate deaminase|nr:endoribonuclease [Solirubrobacterales bacterium]